jgi:DNA-binding SARP family transcriptional activator
MQSLIEAVELYRGELLLGYYEDWMIPEQRRLEELFFQAVRELIDCLKAAGDITCAINYAHRAVSLDPLREELHCELMQLYVTAGQPSAALRQYHDLERILREKLNLLPSAATRQLVREIRKQWAEGRRQKADNHQPSTINHQPSLLIPHPSSASLRQFAAEQLASNQRRDLARGTPTTASRWRRRRKPTLLSYNVTSQQRVTFTSRHSASTES